MDIKEFLALNITKKEKTIFFLHDFSKGIIGVSIALLIIYFFFLNNINLNDYINMIKNEKPVFVIILSFSLILFVGTFNSYKKITNQIKKGS